MCWPGRKASAKASCAPELCAGCAPSMGAHLHFRLTRLTREKHEDENGRRSPSACRNCQPGACKIELAQTHATQVDGGLLHGATAYPAHRLPGYLPGVLLYLSGHLEQVDGTLRRLWQLPVS